MHGICQFPHAVEEDLADSTLERVKEAIIDRGGRLLFRVTLFPLAYRTGELLIVTLPQGRSDLEGLILALAGVQPLQEDPSAPGCVQEGKDCADSQAMFTSRAERLDQKVREE